MPVGRLLNASLYAAFAVLVSACSTGRDIDITLHEGPQESVYLERISDRSVQAAHPINIDPTVIARVLRGVFAKDIQGAVHTFFSGAPDAYRAFSDDDVAYLAPLISEGLQRAAADQQVGFRLTRIGQPGITRRRGGGVGSSEPPLELHPKETTSGVIRASGESLYLTIREFRVRPEPADTINMPNRRLPDRSGMKDKELAFEPKEALKPNGKGSFFGASSDTVFIIDYQQLARMPVGEAPVSTADQRPSQPKPQPEGKEQDIKQIKEDMRRKDAEIENLKKEMEEIRRDMGKPATKTP